MNLDFSDIKVLLIGDFMIDYYIIGTSNRMSPEAPVPVVTPEKEYFVPGGAGNVAMNLCAMGANVSCLGFVGNDSWGKKLLSIFKNKNIDIQNIDVINNHPTTLKQRIYSDNEQIARLDTEKHKDWIPTAEIQPIYDSYDIIILSDYNKGVHHRPWFQSKKSNIILDPKYGSEHLWMNTNIVTPNLNELKTVSKVAIDSDQSIINACNQLIQQYNLNYIVAKKGSQGITVVGKDNFVKHIKAHPVQNSDVTGAGDTVIAALSIAYAKNQDIELSAKFANAAAAIVVGKAGTATATIEEIEQLFTK